jgi:hypothetical protein
MPDQADNITVTITTLPGNPLRCAVDPQPFVVKPSRMVMFVFKEFPDADIIFSKDSPFEEKKFKPGSHKIKDADVLGLGHGSPPIKSITFDYQIEWLAGDGQGNGSGEVTGG